MVKNVFLTYDIDHVKVGTNLSRYFIYQYNLLIEISLLSKSMNLKFEKDIKVIGIILLNHPKYTNDNLIAS